MGIKKKSSWIFFDLNFCDLMCLPALRRDRFVVQKNQSGWRENAKVELKVVIPNFGRNPLIQSSRTGFEQNLIRRSRPRVLQKFENSPNENRDGSCF